MTRFSKMLPQFTKKGLQDSLHVRVTVRVILQFSQFEYSLQPFTDNESLAYKHKSTVMNKNILLCVTTVNMTHFATVRATRARVTCVQDFVTECWAWYSVCYIAGYTTLQVMNASR